METVAPAGVRLLSVCRVAPAPALPPRQMPVDNCSNVKAKLSFLDVPWVATPPVQEVFLYEKGGGAEYGGMVKRLKESLAASLALYLPLAGKLAYVQETRDIVVDCSDPGVAFFEAEAMAGCMDLSRLASDDDDDVPAMELASLVPEHDARCASSAGHGRASHAVKCWPGARRLRSPCGRRRPCLRSVHGRVVVHVPRRSLTCDQ